MIEMRLEEARVDRVKDVISFVDSILMDEDCTREIRIQILIAVEELIMNIASYAYTQLDKPGPAVIQVEIEEEPHSMSVTFIDSGIPFDPLAMPDPDVKLPCKDRRIGGLGVYMVKKSMDNITYKYSNGQNILTISKLL